MDNLSSFNPFSHVVEAPLDPILGLTDQFRADSNPKKVNLCIGVYQDDSGKNSILSCVKQAERISVEEETTKDYLSIAGESAYGEGVRGLIFGAEQASALRARAITMHTPGGTGALRLGGDFLKATLPEATVWVSNPTWPNHNGVFQAAELPIKSYPYYDFERHQINFDQMLETLEKTPSGDVILLHVCCHNPSGCDLSTAQWEKLYELFQRRSLIPFLDFAYQGFGNEVEQDAFPVKLFAQKLGTMLISSSFSKNMGLYRERCGALTVLCPSDADTQRVSSQLKIHARRSYSNPPSHGGKIVQGIISRSELTALWKQELAEMAERMHTMRRLFVEGMTERGFETQFSFITNQRGMFSISGMSKEQVLSLRAKHGVYLMNDGRINISGLTTSNIGYVCDSIADTLKTVTSS